MPLNLIIIIVIWVNHGVGTMAKAMDNEFHGSNQEFKTWDVSYIFDQITDALACSFTLLISPFVQILRPWKCPIEGKRATINKEHS